jgi:hypothetical protein
MDPSLVDFKLLEPLNKVLAIFSFCFVVVLVFARTRGRTVPGVCLCITINGFNTGFCL